MPHAFWHQWGDERTEQERLQAAALERIDNLERFGTADPSIWQEYIQAPIQDDVVPAVTDAFGNYVSNVTGRAQDTAEQIYSLPYVPEVVGGAVGGIEKVQENVFNPIVSRSLEPLPIKWEESPPDAPKGGEGAWWDSVVPDRLQQGRVVRDFDQYLTPEGEISPSGVMYWSKLDSSLPCCNLSLTRGSHQVPSPPLGASGGDSSHLIGNGSNRPLTAGVTTFS